MLDKLSRIFIFTYKEKNIKNFFFLFRKGVEIQIVLTKCDMVIPPDLARRYVVVKEKLQHYKNVADDPLMVSARKKTGILKLRKEVLRTVDALEKARQAIQKKSVLIENDIIKGRLNENCVTKKR